MISRRTWILIGFTLVAAIITLVLVFQGKKADCRNMVGSLSQGQQAFKTAAWNPSEHARLLQVQDNDDSNGEAEKFDPQKQYLPQTPQTPCTISETRLSTARGIFIAATFVLLLSTCLSILEDRREARRRRRRARRDHHHQRRRERMEHTSRGQSL